MVDKKKNDVPMFEHKGVKYPYFIANKTGTVGSPIFHPDTKKKIGILGADFAWENSEPFIRRMDLKIRDERNVREDESVRHRANIITQNSRLFRDLVQKGFAISIDEEGETGKEVAKTRDEMLAYRPELQSQIVDDWLGNFHIRRVFPDGLSGLDAIVSTPDKIYFECGIGTYKNPTQILLLEFNVPSADACRSYEDDTFLAGSKQEGDKQVTSYNVNHTRKIQFAKKYLDSVKGAALVRDEKMGEVDIDTEDLVLFEANDTEALKKFKSAFNPNWMILLADELAGCFNFTGK